MAWCSGTASSPPEGAAPVEEEAAWLLAGGAHEHHRGSQQDCGKGQRQRLSTAVTLTEVPGSMATWLLATSYKWVSFSPTISPSFVGEGPPSWPLPPSRYRCCLGCGRLGSGVVSCCRRCGEKKEQMGATSEKGKDISACLYPRGQAQSQALWGQSVRYE